MIHYGVVMGAKQELDAPGTRQLFDGDRERLRRPGYNGRNQ
jgi:hypothetical protein